MEARRHSRPASRPDALLTTWVATINSLEALQTHLADWEDLAAVALEPNVFYEPSLLLPALRELADQHVRLLLVFVQPVDRPTDRVLAGLFPVRHSSRFKHLPVPGLSLWAHVHCYLCTPLVRRDFAAATLDALLNWLHHDASAPDLMEFRQINGDGPFWDALCAALQRHACSVWEPERWERALLRPRGDADDYLEALPRRRLKECRRRMARLRQMGSVSVTALQPGDDVGGWLEAFLALEASGWKAKLGTALACDERQGRFFTQAATAAFEQGTLWMDAIRVDGVPIAMGVAFRSGPGGFIFKTAVDERYKASSPGILLHLEQIRRAHDSPGLAWVDSCTDPASSTWNELFLDRRALASVVCCGRRSRGSMAVAVLPTLRAWYREAATRASRWRAMLRGGRSNPNMIKAI